MANNKESEDSKWVLGGWYTLGERQKEPVSLLSQLQKEELLLTEIDFGFTTCFLAYLCWPVEHSLPHTLHHPFAPPSHLLDSFQFTSRLYMHTWPHIKI